MNRFFDENIEPSTVIEQSGMTIPAIMGEMMERGYLVSGTEGHVSLIKVATESDPKSLVNPDFEADDRTRITNIQTKMHALAIYLLLRDKAEVQAPKMIEWRGQVRYEIGRNIKFHELTSIMAITYDDALEIAKQQANAFIENRPDLARFGYKEVKVRPA